MERCGRCFKETNVTTGSYFNTQMICIPCDKKERAHPDFKKAKDAEFAQVKSGNLNFEGIGLPSDL